MIYRTDKSKTTITKGQGYTRVSNALINDPTLPSEAIGMGLKILSKPDNWVIHPKNFWHSGADGRTKTYRIFDMLIQAGYMKKTPIRVNGKVDALYDFSETPRFQANESPVEKPLKERNKGKFSKSLVPGSGTGLVPGTGIREGQSLVPGTGTLLMTAGEEPTTQNEITTEEKKETGAPGPAPSITDASGMIENPERESLRSTTLHFGYAFSDSELDSYLAQCKASFVRDPVIHFFKKMLDDENSKVYHWYFREFCMGLREKGVKDPEWVVSQYIKESIDSENPSRHLMLKSRMDRLIESALDGEKNEVV